MNQNVHSHTLDTWLGADKWETGRNLPSISRLGAKGDIRASYSAADRIYDATHRPESRGRDVQVFFWLKFSSLSATR